MDQVLLQIHGQDAAPPQNAVRSWSGVTAELVHVPASTELDFKLTGSTHYIALHDMSLTDGETCLDESAPIHFLDLRDRLTFLPRGCGISGWSKLSNRRHSFVALHFRSDVVETELERRASGEARADLYFLDRALQGTLRKIQHELSNPEPANEVYLETLAVLAMIETQRHAARAVRLPVVASGALSRAQERLVRDFIVDNMTRHISLADLAALAGLSRFHFSRAFKVTFGTSPHRFVTACRIERAKQYLVEGSLPIGAISRLTGFSSSEQFATVFRRVTGIAPAQYRRARR